MSYATAVQFKAAITIEDTVEDTEIQRALDAATEWIDNFTGRVFGAVTASQSRTFEPTQPWRLDVPDLATVSAIAVDTRGDLSFTTSLSAGQYELRPLNVGQPGVRGNYTEIRIRPNSSQGFGYGNQVRVTGTWGYGSTPASVEEACILLANRYFRRPSAPFGVQEAPQSGTLATLPENDPDVVALLEDFAGSTRTWVAV